MENLENDDAGWEIVIHPNPDIDAGAAAWLLKRQGEEKYPSIAHAKIILYRPEIRKRPGMIFVDCGDQDFDHHPIEKFPDECATTLVAKCLGVADDPCLQKILKAVLASDLKGGDHPLSYGQGIKDMNLLYPNGYNKVLVWLFEGLDAKYNAELDFQFSQYGSEVQKIEVVLPRDIVRYVYASETDSRSFAKMARYKGAALIVQKNSRGQVQIQSNKQIEGLIPVMEDIAVMLRREEAIRKKVRLTTDRQILIGEGKLPDVPEWYYHKGLNAVMNGSLTTPNVPPTRIPFEIIKNLVVLAITPTLPKSVCANGGQCLKYQCDLFFYWLNRCRRHRFETIHKQNQQVPVA